MKNNNNNVRVMGTLDSLLVVLPRMVIAISLAIVLVALEVGK